MPFGRIIKGVGGLYGVAVEGGLYTCTPAGIFRKNKITPVIGDMCEISVIDEKDRTAAITRIMERRNEIARPRVSNIDQLIIVMAADNPPLDTNMLDRYLVILENNNFDIVICINKSDLSKDGAAGLIKQLYAEIGYKVIYMSAMLKNGGTALTDTVKSRVSAFAGPSGVGKSSIINLLAGRDIMQTGGLSKKIARGKHTTRHVEFLSLDDNTYVLDTPGFTSLTLEGISPESLTDLFIEFGPFTEQCAFRDCAHINEPGCAVKEEVGKSISVNRYNNYLSFYGEIKNSR